MLKEKFKTKMIKKILLINLPFEKIYEKTTLKALSPTIPPLGLACIGASLIKCGHQVKIFDYNLYGDKEYIQLFKEFNPNYIGITFVTPLIREADKISRISKKMNGNIKIICGGAHPSSFPKSSLKETDIDIAVVGEGDFSICEIVNGKKLSKIKGIAYKERGKIKLTKKREFIKNLDDLPFPAYHLYETKKYHVPSEVAKNLPAVWYETSRGCVFGCTYCNKSCFGRTFRVKSPEKVVEEFIKIKNMGIKDILLTDDGFTTDMDRAKKICDLLIKKKVNISWSAITGIRVDRVDRELLFKMKQAGCYRFFFGIESGNQKILNTIQKGITLEQVRNAVRLAKEAKIEIYGAFMLGLPGETEKTMQDTINFAKELDLDLAKASITIPLPATPLFEDLKKNGRIKTEDWEKFKFYSTPSAIYDHEHLSWDVIEKYHKKFFRTLYLNPRFLFKRIKNSIKNKKVIKDIKMALTIRWL
ncbi:MAG: radical SAM protein [Enterobacteriaceae bacterium]|nr:radical SAM protein [Enterobacteriaceae bacterium]